ncbi:MAG: hypothetical protein AB7F86_04415 [Bdellovibrionales bacterium]
MRFWLALALVFAASSAQARVFSFKESGLGMFLRGTGGTSAVGDDPFAKSSGSDTSVSGKTSYAYSGELGVVFGLGSMVNLRLGAEVIQHHPVKETSGKNSSDIERFQLDSSTFIFNPNLTMEVIFHQEGNTRYFGELGVGNSEVTVENRYTMTSTGTSELGVTDFNEKLSATALSYHVAAGLETLFTDTVTFVAQVGYRILTVDSLKYKGDVNNIVSPSGAAKGDKALKNDGTARSLDLSGVFVGVAFRFWLHF